MLLALVNYRRRQAGQPRLNVLVVLKSPPSRALILGGLWLSQEAARRGGRASARPAAHGPRLRGGPRADPLSYGGWQNANILAEEIREPGARSRARSSLGH